MTRPTPRLADGLMFAAVVVGSFLVYRASPGAAQLCDSCYSLAVSEAVLDRGTVRLDGVLPSDPGRLARLPGFDPEYGLPYHLVRKPDGEGGGVYYGYPLGSTVLSMPLVAYYSWARGLTTVGPDGTYLLASAESRLAGELPMQMRIAAVVVALTAGLFYVVGRGFLGVGGSGLLAAGFATGSMAWSTLARGLWSHTWAVALTTAVVLILVHLARRKDRTRTADILSGLALGTLMFGMYFVRPQTVLSAVGVLAALAVWDRRVLAGAVAGGLAWSAGLVAWSTATFGTTLPPVVYSPGAIDGVDVGYRFAGLMISPSRGLLVFCPYLAVFAYFLAAYRTAIPSPRLLAPAGLAVGGYVALFSNYLGWHGGYCYGPRYFSDILPWFVLAGAMAVRAWLDANIRPGRRAVEAGVLAVCVGWAVFAHGRGAVAVDAWEWNYTARTNEDHERLATDWAHPQFLAGLTFDVGPDGTFRDR